MRDWFKNWLFRDEREEYERLVRQARRDAVQAKYELQDVVRHGKSLTVVDLVREHMRGFDPRALDSEDELIEMLDEGEGADAFLAEVKNLYDNGALGRILTYIERNQIAYTAKEAETLDKVNFGRATLNGIALVREEIERLHTLFVERHRPPEEFDPHEAL